MRDVQGSRARPQYIIWWYTHREIPNILPWLHYLHENVCHYLAPGKIVRTVKYCDCLCVRMLVSLFFIRSHPLSQQSYVQILPNILYMLPVAVARGPILIAM